MFVAMLSKLAERLWGKHGSQPQPVHIIMYSRKGCHLCDLAWDQLQRARQRYALALEAIDVDLDPDLQAQFGETVPVVCIDGAVRFRGRVNDVLLNRLLDAKVQGRAPMSL